MKQQFILAALAVAQLSFAQVGIGTNTPTSGTVLDVSSSSKAFIIPRLTTAQRDAINPATAGMLIYNTTTAKFQGYAGSGAPTSLAGSTVGLTDESLSDNFLLAQSFQVSGSASDYNISFWVYQLLNGYTSAEVTLELRSGTPATSNSLLASQSITVNSTGKFTVPIRNTILSTGSDYYFILKPTTSFGSSSISLLRSNGATPGNCSTGALWYSMGNMWGASGVDDLKFDISTLGGSWVDLH